MLPLGLLDRVPVGSFAHVVNQVVGRRRLVHGVLLAAASLARLAVSLCEAVLQSCARIGFIDFQKRQVFWLGDRAELHGSLLTRSTVPPQTRTAVPHHSTWDRLGWHSTWH